MQKITTRLFLTALMLLMAVPVMAQVTIRDINAIPEDQLAALEGAAGATLTQDIIDANIFNDLVGTEVTLTVVVMSDPRNSGLSNFSEDIGGPSRVHYFVRDTSAVSMGPEGMGVQVVDGAWQDNNALSFGRGDVIELTASVGPFGTAMQLSPTAAPVLLGSYSDLGLPETILDPVVITTDQLNSDIGDGNVQVNFSNLASLRNQFVRIEDGTVQTRLLADPDRPDFYVTSDGGATVANFYDTGVQFRNDRGDYPDTFNPADDDFVPPPPGALVNMQGFVIYQGGSDGIGRAVPDDAVLSVAPMERRGCDDETSPLRCDLELLESPPVISDIAGPGIVPDGSAPVTISFGATADPARTLMSNACEYFTSADATLMSVDATEDSGTFTCEFPAQEDGVFVVYTIVSTDNTGGQSSSDQDSYRTLVDGIDSISDVQLTFDEGPGDSPHDGVTTALDITAYVVSDPATSGLTVIQEDLELNGWTGVFLDTDETLTQGDMINITNATVEEQFGVTQLAELTMSVVSSGNTVPDYKVVPTTVLLDEGIAEAHEGMLLRFDNVVIGENPDAPRDFGEWSFASSGTEDFLRADDRSAGIESDFNASLAPETELDFIQGIWWFSFDNYKLVPESIEDLMGGGVANEDEILPNSFALDQNYPNPFNPTTTISYQVPTTGLVKLEVFDLLGRSVGVLVNGTVTAGQYTVDFDAASLSSGVYLYRLSAGENVETRKMLLMK